MYNNYIKTIVIPIKISFIIYYLGKTTFCHGMKMFLEAIGRNCIIINLDFANDKIPYEAAIDIRDLISLEVILFRI